MNFLYALPAILGFTGFVIHLVLSNRRPPSPVLMGILDVVRKRAGRVPPLDERLSGKAVYDLLSKNQELRKAITPEEMELLHGIRADEQSESRRVFAFLAFALSLSLILFVVLEWRPWDKAPARPISEVLYNVRLRSPVPADYKPTFDQLQTQMTALLAQTQGKENGQKLLHDQGLYFECQLGKDPAKIGNYQVTLMPGGEFAANLLKTQRPPLPPVFTTLMLSITLVENTEAAVEASLTDPKAPSLWQDNLLALVDSPYTPLTLTLDFSTGELVYGLNSVKAFQPRVTQSVKYWGDFKNNAIVIFPAMLADAKLERFEICSSVGPEQPTKTQTLQTRTRTIQGESQKYFVFR
jgi:hypothetical protein